MTTLINDLELDDDAIAALKELCKETRMKANERYLGTGELDTANDHPSETKRAIKKVVREKYEHLA